MGTGNLTVYLNFIYKIFLVALPRYLKKKKGEISGSSPNGGGKKINTLQFLFYYKRKINIVQNSYSRVLNISKRKRERSRILVPMGTGNLTIYLNFIYKIFLVALPRYFKKKKGEISGSSSNGGRTGPEPGQEGHLPRALTCPGPIHDTNIIYLIFN